MSSDREEGFYYVLYDHEWTVAKWEDNDWIIPGVQSDDTYDSDIKDVGPQIPDYEPEPYIYGDGEVEEATVYFIDRSENPPKVTKKHGAIRSRNSGGEVFVSPRFFERGSNDRFDKATGTNWTKRDWLTHKEALATVAAIIEANRTAAEHAIAAERARAEKILAEPIVVPVATVNAAELVENAKKW